jgi:hypothetical protein
MPRTKSTAVLQACKRSVKLNEPFDVYNLPNYNKDTDGYLYRVRSLVEYDQWDSLLTKLNQKDTAVKIFGHSLMFYYNARAWFDAAMQTHEIFTLIRNPKEMILSELIAFHFGHTKDSETENREITISDYQFYTVQSVISSFLRFYPSTGKLVTFDTLPTECFDKTQIQIQEQHSGNKTHFIKNIDEVHRNIDLMLSYYQAEWKDKTGLDIHAPLAQR